MKRPIPEHVKRNLAHLQRWAMRERQHYGCAVWLVGSALSGNNPKPRDWDIRVIVPDAQFVARFGISAQQWQTEGVTGKWSEGRWRWADECVKSTQDGWSHTGLNIDFQIYPASHARRMYPLSLPRLRLDQRRK